MKRSCDECAKCCEGWLTANIYGHVMQPGVKCHFLAKTCTIYNDRPENPCQLYKCAWLDDETNQLPEWLKPSYSDVIISKRVYGKNADQFYWDVTECGKTISSVVLNWIFIHTMNNHINVSYMVNGMKYNRGSQDFLEFMASISR
jgi:uncharacterized cysteine cluster protein YcgN (CxxCxxCC family)